MLPSEQINSPHDLWVVPSPRLSRWFARLDWYLNWQMCKGLAYGGLHLPAETYRTAEDNGIPIFTWRRDANLAPLFISAEGRIPAKGCLVVEGAEDLKNWLKEISGLAAGLSARQLRIFLPSGVSVEQAREAWPKKESGGSSEPDSAQIHFSPDLGALA